MKSTASVLGLILSTCTAVSLPAQMLDDFESYESSQIVGVSAQSSPWFRIGAATLDNVTVTSNGDRVIAGRLSGQYLVQWPASFGSARYRFESPRDLQACPGFSVMLKSDLPESQTRVRLLINGMDTVYLARAEQALTTDARLFSTTMAEADYERVYGEAAFDQVLRKVEALGFQATHPADAAAAEVSELILIDDLRLLEVSAEPQ